jgi:mono/diheme cytochrome c family protein
MEVVMKRIAKWVGIALGGLALLVLGLVGFVQVTYSFDHPDTPYPAIAATDDPEVIAHGEYLVHAVAHCSTCHAPGGLDPEQPADFSQPLTGGYVIRAGPFGTYTSVNLTPHATGIGRMSDGEIARAVRHGVGRDGRLAPVMMLAVGDMSDEDLTAVISYLRSREPVEGVQAKPAYGIMARALSSRFGPRLAQAPPYVPPGEISAERGRYLAEGPAMCSGCHTPADPFAGFAPSGPLFSGAAAADPDPYASGFEINAPNLTPHPTTGHITDWSEDGFVARFGAGRMITGSTMPWEAFGLLTENDVRSIYRYLRTVPPVAHNTGPTYRKAGSFKP